MVGSEHFVNFAPTGISLLFTDENIVLRQVIWLTPPKQDNTRKTRQNIEVFSWFNQSQQFIANYALLVLFDAKLRHVALVS